MKKFIAGMVKDPERVDQPEGSYRDALNANLYYHKGAVVSEQGTTAFTNVGGFVVDNMIGQCPLKDGRIVLFFLYTLNGNSTCAISIADPATMQNTIIYRNAALNFQRSHTIEATSKIDVNGNILVYFTDNYLVKRTESLTGIEFISEFNPPRVINITRQQTSPESRLYSNEDYTVEKLDLFLNGGFIPEFRDIRIEEGGGVVSGTYHLALAYVDEDLNRTNYLATSNPVHVVTEHEDSIPTESITGDPQGSQSNKSIIWSVDIPAPSNYTHVRPVIIQRFGGGTNQSSSEFAYELEIVEIPETNAAFAQLEITYTGLEQAAGASISEVVIDSVRYETAKTFVQLDNRLYIANLKARGDIGYQRFANSITVAPVATTVPKFDPKRYHTITLREGYSNFQGLEASDDFDIYKTLQSDDLNDGFFASDVRKGYKDVRMSHQYRGYRRSEVYAFYISFVLNDGTETFAYHIPGREPTVLLSAGSQTVTVNENSELTAQIVNTIKNSDINLDLDEFVDMYPDARLHQVTDTQYIQAEYSNEMSFWENEDELYPDTADFDRFTADPTSGDPVDQGDIRGEKVRHHKMPPNKNLNYSFVDSLNAGGVNANLFGSNLNVTGLHLTESIKILGVKFNNIPIPDFIRDQVQGFKIYYAKRTQQEKTIIGQSVVVPAWYEDIMVPGTRMSTAAHGPYSDAWFLKGQLPSYNNVITKSDYPGGNGKKRKVFPVFAFHDFNLLKNKHTLSGASHIDVQKLLTMRMWSGGNKKKPGDGLKYMLDSDWVNSTIGNESWYEWANDGSGTFNAERAVGVTTDGPNADAAGVANYYTSILVAQRYNNPNYVNNPAILGSYNFNNDNYEYWLNNHQTIAVLDANSKTYITGSTLLKNTDSAAFKNVDNLMHYAGESCIALGLMSGLPAMVQHANFSSDFGSSAGVIDWWTQAEWSSVKDGGLKSSLHQTNVTNQGSDFQAWPAVYLVNLCVYKTNVYKPFDQQRLVWTGYYQKIDKTQRGVTSTDTVFGGDTYVGRYSFRSTSQDFGAVFLTNANADATNSDNWSTNPYQLYSVNGSNTQQEDRAVDPYATVFQFLCESDDLLGFRHQGDTAAGVTPLQSLFWDGSIGTDVLFNGPDNDMTKSEHLLYMNNYSAVQDIKVTTPLPKKLFNPTAFPTRTIRSTVDDGSIQDKYRFFLALDFKDLPKNRGPITKLFTLGSILYLHTERSLFVTRGRQQLGLGDNTQAFVGSGDIFEQNPDEMIPTTEGYGGTDCQFASLTTRFGQFFVNRRDRRVYMMGESIEEVSSLGMEKWFLDNIPYAIESYLDFSLNTLNFDSPTENFGFNATYDPKYKRIILSKKELVPIGALLGILTGGFTVTVDNITNDGITLSGNFPSAGAGGTQTFLFSDRTSFQPDGWTISYYPELKVWGSRHSYLPAIFANNQKEYYGLVNGSGGNVWEHSNLDAPGVFYGTTYNFEFEYIDNAQAGTSKIFTNIRYWADVVNINNTYPSEVDRHTSPGFTTFYTYNTHQVSGVRNIYYLNNARLVDRFWYVNDFRDLSVQANNTAAVLANNQLNVQDDFNTGTTTSLVNTSMFTEEGTINANYIDNNKVWYNQKKFVDHFMGVRLVSDNLTGNLIYLYAAGTKFRQSFR
jgi:hypothetical protein